MKEPQEGRGGPGNGHRRCFNTCWRPYCNSQSGIWSWAKEKAVRHCQQRHALMRDLRKYQVVITCDLGSVLIIIFTMHVYDSRSMNCWQSCLETTILHSSLESDGFRIIQIRTMMIQMLSDNNENECWCFDLNWIRMPIKKTFFFYFSVVWWSGTKAKFATWFHHHQIQILILLIQKIGMLPRW